MEIAMYEFQTAERLASPITRRAFRKSNYMTVRVGNELRRRRNELGLTLQEVAEQADLSRGFLSQVENERVSPSLKSLGQIAAALRVPMFQLMNQEGRNPVVRSGERQTFQFEGTGVEVALLTPFRDWQMLPFQRVLSPGEEYSAVRLDRAREEWLLVQSGSLEITLYPDDQYLLDCGDTIHFESSRLVGMRNTSQGPTEFISMITPPAP